MKTDSKSSRRWRLYACACAVVGGFAALPASAQTSDDDTTFADEAAGDTRADELLDLSLEDLLTIESTSVAKKRQDVRDAAAAVTVITQDDIQRSAARTIADLLRMVPGVEVGTITTGKNAVAVRGFNSRVSDSLLVMIDGRSIYVSTLSGVFWELLTLPLNDIERIEVIRGPGASLWGANAVNGVINIITKHSADTLGTQVSAHVGTRMQDASLSYGQRVGDDLTYRIYGKVAREESLLDKDGNRFSDASRTLSAGLRVDWQPTTADAFSVAAEMNSVQLKGPFLRIEEDPLNLRLVPDTMSNDNSSASLVARWVHQQSETFEWSLQFALDHISAEEFSDVRLRWTQADLDLGLHWKASETHDLNFGIGARVNHDELQGTPYVWLDPAELTERWISGYVQDDISIIPDRLRLTLGAKLEQNNITGFELQPNARIFYRPAQDFAMWASASRAVRTPSRYERAAVFDVSVQPPNSEMNPLPLPLRGRLLGSPDRRSVTLDSIEAGVRWTFLPHWTLDVALYHNEYNRLPLPVMTAFDPVFVDGVPYPVSYAVDNSLSGEVRAKTRGGEVSLAGKLAPWWQVDLSWSHFTYSVEKDPFTGQPHTLVVRLDGTPRDQFMLRTGIDLPGEVSINGVLRHTTDLGVGIPAYTEADLKVTYQAAPGVDVSLSGQNLLHARHATFTESAYPNPVNYVPRSVSAELRYRF